MANSYIVLPGDITGKKIRTRKQTEDNNNVEDMVIEIANQPIPEHKTYFLFGTTSAQTDDLTPATGKRFRIYGFYGAYTVSSAYNPSADGSLSFGTGGLTDRTKILGASGKVAGARTMIFTMTPMNRLGEVNEIIRFTMATFDAGVAIGNFVILYNEE